MRQQRRIGVRVDQTDGRDVHAPRLEHGDFLVAHVDDEHRAHGCRLLERARDGFRVAPVVHERDEIGVAVEVAELACGVPVVHVHRHGSELVRGEHRFEVLRAVVQLEPDMVSRADATRRERVREPVRAGVELCVGEAYRRRDDRLPLGHGVGDPFEQVCEVEGHASDALGPGSSRLRSKDP